MNEKIVLRLLLFLMVPGLLAIMVIRRLTLAKWVLL